MKTGYFILNETNKNDLYFTLVNRETDNVIKLYGYINRSSSDRISNDDIVRWQPKGTKEKQL